MGAKTTASELGLSMLRGHAVARLSVAQTGFLLDVARREGFEFDTHNWTIEFPIDGVPYSLYRWPNRASILQPAIHVRTRMAPGVHSFEEVKARYAEIHVEWETEMRQQEESRAWMQEWNRVRETEGLEAAHRWAEANV